MINCQKIPKNCQKKIRYNNIEVGACIKHNVLLTNTPDVLTNATAELTFSCLMNLARRLREAEKSFLSFFRFSSKKNSKKKTVS